MKVVVSDNLHPKALELIKETGSEVVYKPESLESALSDAEVLIVRSATKVTPELLSKAPNLKLIMRGGVGLDNINQVACKSKGIEVLNTPTVSTNAVAEITIGLILCAVRNIPRAHYTMKQGKWEKKALSGTEIQGKTLGLIGCGRIGSLVGEKARSLGMKTIGFNPPPRYGTSIEYIDSLDEFLKKADIISLHVPLVPSTDKMINTESISKMKDGVIIINTARGRIIDEDALFEACKSKKVRAACLDVYCEEPYKGKLLELENIIFTPHLGAATEEAQIKIGKDISKKINSME